MQTLRNRRGWIILVLAAVILGSRPGIAQSPESVLTPAARPRVTVGGPGAEFSGMSNTAIQAAIDHLVAVGGGVAELTEGEFLIKDAIRLKSNITLRGQGPKTILRKCDAVRSVLVEDNDEMSVKVEVADGSGFEVGTGVTIGDNKDASQDKVMVRTITWKSGNTLGFAQPLKEVAMAREDGYVQTTFPVLYIVGVQEVRVENLVLEGNKSHNQSINSWLDGAIWLTQAKDIEIRSCEVRNFNGFTMVTHSEDVRVVGCQIHDNSREGIHVGGDTRGFVVKNCRIFNNGTGMKGRGGLYLCFRARNGLYEGNEIFGNTGDGILIGYRDGGNLFVNNVIRNNSEAGVWCRGDTHQTYGNVFRNCVIEDNGSAGNGYGVYLGGDARYTRFEGVKIRDTRPAGKKLQRFGLYDDGVKDVVVENCTIEGNAEQNIVRK